MEKEMETTIVYWGYIGIMEEEMETTIAYWGYMGIMEKKILHYNGRYVRGVYGDNGKENGNYYYYNYNL